MLFPIDALPTATLVCTTDGTVIAANQKVKNLLDRDLMNQRIDTVLDFSKTDLNGCHSFSDVLSTLKNRSRELNAISISYAHHLVSHLNLHFNVYAQDSTQYVLVSLNDVSERAKLLEAFEYKQNLLDNILTTSMDALVVFDAQGYIELFSPAAEVMFGKTSTEMIIEDVYCLFESKSHEKITQVLQHLINTKDSKEVLVFEDIVPVKSSGDPFPASITFSKSQKDSNSIFFMVVSDKSLFHKFVNSVNDAYVKTDSQGVIIDVNKKTEALFHYDRETLLNKHISFLEIVNNETFQVVDDVSSLVNNSTGEEDFIAKNRRGGSLTLNLTVWPQEVNSLRLNNLIIRDISQKKLAEQQLVASAFTDPLTSLSNRARFNKELQDLISARKTVNKKFALLSIDLDKFKDVNDSFGHDYGDELLKAAASRLTACVREHDLVSRMGGDEFTVLIREIESVDLIEKVANRILRAFRREFSLKHKRVSVSASIGLAIFPDDGDSFETIFKASDMAMYAAKRSGKNDYRHFTEALYNEYERQKLIERELACAVDKHELYLQFQPKISISKKCVIGFEALLRWNNSIIGNVSPVEFIPIAEDSGKIIEITKWVLHNGFQAMNRLKTHLESEANEKITLAINISADHFKEDLVEDLEEIINAENFTPNLLEIEITEGTLLEHTSTTVDALKKISAMGVHICMDDFGTGYSSLQYLKQFTLNTIKIDRSFVKDIDVEPQNIFIIESIVAIAKRLNLDVVVEGVETQDQLDKVVALGCDVIQGYFFSKPIAEADILPFLSSIKSRF